MRLTDADLRQLHAEMTAPADRSRCLPEDLLLRAGEGRLGGAEKEMVANHIAQCSACAREYRVAVSMRPLLEKRDRRPFAFALAAAALLFVVLLPLLWLTWNRQRNPVVPPVTMAAEPVRPNLDAPIVDLDTDVVRGPGTAVPTIIVPPGADVFTTILHLDEEVRGAVALSIEGPVRWSGTWTAREPAAVVTMTLHRRQFPAGEYVVRAHSGSFRFRVEYR
jgi:hypothetical protein